MESWQDMVLEFMQQVEAMPSGLQKKVRTAFRQLFLIIFDVLKRDLFFLYGWRP